MNSNDYQKEAKRTDRECYDSLNIDKNQKRLLHHAIGIAGEAGELVDAVKKHIFYSQQLDVENIKEELGDLLWYIANAASTIDVSIEELMQQNVDKLQKRYKKGFSEKEAKQRADKN